MASAGAIKAGEAYVRMFLDKGDLERQLKVIQGKLNRFASTVTKVGAGFAVIGAAGVTALGKAVSAANQVELTARRLDAVFQDGADSARDFARTLGKEIGDSRFAIEKTLVTFKSFFAEIVKSERQQTELSKRLTRLSRDFAAFQGLTTDDALQRFISALSGSPEVLDRFGINLKAAAINAELAAMGIEGTTATVSEFEKVIARLNIIDRTLGAQGAIGKAREELEKFAGQLRAASAAAFDFLVSVGRALIPVVKPIVGLFTDAVRVVTALADAFPILAVVTGLAFAALLTLGGALIAAGVAITALATLIGIASGAFLLYQKAVATAAASNTAWTVTVLGMNLQIGRSIPLMIGSKQALIGWSGSATVATKASLGLGAALKGILSLIPGLALIAIGLEGGPAAFAAIAAATLFAALALQKYTGAATRSAKINKVLTKVNGALAASFVKLGISARIFRAPLRGVLGLLGRITPAIAIIASLAATLGLILAALARRVGQILGLGGLITGVTTSLKALFSTALAGVRSLVKQIPGVSKAVNGIGNAISWVVDRTKDGIDELKDIFASARKFLGLGGVVGDNGEPEIESEASAQEREAREVAVAERRKAIEQELEDLRVEGIRDRTQQELAAINLKYDREVEEAGDASDQILAINRNREQAIANLRNRLVAEFYQRLKALDAQIDRVRAEGIENQYARQRRLAEITLREALSNEKLTNQEKQKQAELFAARIENIEKRAALRRQEFNAGLDETLEQLRIDGIEDRLQQELESIRVRYEAERKEAQKLNADLEKVDQLRRKREEQAFAEEERRRRERQQELLSERADAETNLVDQIARLDIDLGGGSDLQKQLDKIELDRVKAIADSSGGANELKLINELFDKQVELAKQQEAAQKVAGTQGRAFGAFESVAVGAFGGAGVKGRSPEQDLLERSLQEQQRQTKALEDIQAGQGAVN